MPLILDEILVEADDCVSVNVLLPNARVAAAIVKLVDVKLDEDVTETGPLKVIFPAPCAVILPFNE